MGKGEGGGERLGSQWHAVRICHLKRLCRGEGFSAIGVLVVSNKLVRGAARWGSFYVGDDRV